MRRPLWLLAITAFLLVAGATWLVVLLWKTGHVGGVGFVPHFVGAALAGVTLGRLDRRARYLAPLAALGWVGLQLLVHRVDGVAPRWTAATSAAQYMWLLALAPLCAAAAAAIPLPAGETRWRWFWVSALLTFGCMAAPLVATTRGHEIPVSAIVLIVAAPLLAGALTQYLATYRMIWTCGSGMLTFALFIIDRAMTRETTTSVVAPLAGTAFYALLGVGGAALSWRLFRNQDPRTPSSLPTVTAM